MAQPIITQVTLAQLNALIAGSATTWNNNYWGTQFYVTDKDWLLHAYKNNICKPVSGRLTIMNGNTLPTGIEPDVLLVDTGVIDYDISEGYTLTTPSGYLYNSGYMKITNSDGDINSVNFFGIQSFDGLSTGEITVLSYIEKYYQFLLPLVAYGITPSITLQVIIEFHKSPFA